MTDHRAGEMSWSPQKMKVSDDKKRALNYDPPLVYAAAYELTVFSSADGGGDYVDGKWIGCFDSQDDAESWLATGEPPPWTIRITDSTGGPK